MRKLLVQMTEYIPMVDITVKYDDETHTAEKVTIEKEMYDNYAVFIIDGSSASLSGVDCNGEFLSEAFEHVRELPFVQAVEEL